MLAARAFPPLIPPLRPSATLSKGDLNTVAACAWALGHQVVK